MILAIHGLPCGCDNILVLFFMNNRKYLCECLSYSNEAWYQDVPLHHLPVYQISKHSGYLFPLYGNFNTFTKRKKKKKTKKLSQFLEVHISKTPSTIHLKIEMWGTDGGGRLHSKNRLVSCKKYKGTYMQKLHFCSLC